MLLWPEKSSASFYWPLAAAAAPPIMLATSRQLAASFFTQLAGGDSYVAVWRLPVCGRAQHGFLPVGPRACRDPLDDAKESAIRKSRRVAENFPSAIPPNANTGSTDSPKRRSCAGERSSHDVR